MMDTGELGDGEAIMPVLKSTRKGLGFFSLLVVAFFWVSGGIYGNEALLAYAPPGWIIIVLASFPFLYGGPIALISVELSAAMPFDGGAVAWVEEAFGLGIGGHNTYWMWLCYSLDAAVYPVFAAEYIVQHTDLGGLHRDILGPDGVYTYGGPGISIVASSIVVLITLVQLTGTDALVSMNTLFACVSLLPSFIFIFWGLPTINKEFTALEMPPQADFDTGVLMSWGIWLYQGFVSLGALSGEVENPQKTMPIVVLVLMPLLIFLNIMPLAAAWGFDSNYSNYEAGHFDAVASENCGAWLGWSFLVASIMCQLGLLNSTMMAAQRMLYYFLQTRYPKTFGENGTTAGKSKLWVYLWVDPTPGVPAGLILVNGCVGLLAVWIPYAILVEIVVLLVAPSILLLLVAFVQLRRKRPDMERPFKVPVGVYGCIAMVVPVAAITLAQVYLSMIDETEVFGIPYFKMICFFVTIGGGGLVHLGHDIRRFGVRGIWQRITMRAGDESSMLFAHQDNPADDIPKGQSFKKLYS